IPDFLAKLRLYLQNQEVNPADNAGGPPTGREVAIGYLRGCMKGRALEWFDEEITTKQNWELANLLDNTGQANLVAVNGKTAVQIGNQALNEALGQPGNAIVKLRAVEGP
ncbi:4933_t:CDS:1, partial [Cetraspora pellucida]